MDNTGRWVDTIVTEVDTGRLQDAVVVDCHYSASWVLVGHWLHCQYFQLPIVVVEKRQQQQQKKKI
jgi:hypothetical protein